MLIHIGTDYAKVKSKGKSSEKRYILEIYQCDKCGKTMKVEDSYVPTKCHYCEMNGEGLNGCIKTQD